MRNSKTHTARPGFTACCRESLTSKEGKFSALVPCGHLLGVCLTLDELSWLRADSRRRLARVGLCPRHGEQKAIFAA